MNSKRVLAVDPGRQKCGVAVLDRQDGVLHQAIIPSESLASALRNLVAQFECRIVVLGNGTATEEIQRELKELVAASAVDKIETIDERDSTRQARLYYWLENPPQGWRRFLPIGLLVPPVPVDDFAAIILAERYLKMDIKLWRR